MDIRGWFPLWLTGLISLQSKGLPRVCTIQNSQFFGAQSSLWSNSHIRTWLLEKPPLWLDGSLSAKWSLLFNILSRSVIAFLPRSKHLLISWLQFPSTVFLEPNYIKSVTASTFSPSLRSELMGLDAMIFVFWMLHFKPAFSLSSFTFIKRLFNPSSLSAFSVVSPAYLGLLLFLLAILILACNSSSQAFHMMCSA